MTAGRAIIIVFLSTIAVLGIVVGFNTFRDPFCFRCPTIDLSKRTLNAYYRVLQNIAAYPDTEQLLLGTSRGGAFSVDWLDANTGRKTLNASAGGAEVFTKLAFVRVAEQRTKLSSIIWVTDYFEFLDGLQNTKFMSSPPLRNDDVSPLTRAVRWLGFAVDHNTLEASFAMASRRYDFSPTRGGPAPDHCEARRPAPFDDELKRQVEAAYRTYAEGILHRPDYPPAWDAFTKALREWDGKGIRVLVLVPPNHPEFRARMAAAYPALVQKHERWLARLRDLETARIHVVSYFSGFPEDGPGPENWADGDHFTCHAATEMLSGVRPHFRFPRK